MQTGVLGACVISGCIESTPGNTGGSTETNGDSSDSGPTAWRLFRYEWDAIPSEYTLVSRATDANGRVQPATISSPEEGLRKIEYREYP